MSTVIANSNGTVLYPAGTIASSVQARFILKDRYSELPRTRDLGLLRPKSKIVQLKDVSEVFYTNNLDEKLLGNGRVPWEKWLDRSFQSAFRTLINENLKLNFGWALGYAARIFEAVANAEAEVDFDTRKHWIYYIAEGSGYGYVQCLVDRFPELKVAEHYIGNAAGSGFTEARQSYGSSIAKIAEVCGCPHCNPGGYNQNQRKHCLVVVIETILQAGLILSNTYVEEGLRQGYVAFNACMNDNLGPDI